MTVEFGPFANVVRGPSDTGKSYIVEAIDFMLGAKALKSLPEGESYDTVLLGLRDSEGVEFTLSRSMSGGKLGLWEGRLQEEPPGIPNQVLAAVHSKDNIENVSRFLLKKVDLDNLVVRRNVRNETDSLSFRNIARFCVVDETAMQSATPPTQSGRVTDKTKELSTFKLLLQGQDDSDLVATPSKKERKKTAGAKTEVIDHLLAELREQLLGETEERDRKNQLVRVRDSVRAETVSISRLTSRRSDMSSELARTERRLVATERAISSIRTLSARFTLLQEQYESDLQRLALVAEAGTLLGFFNPGQCLFCGAAPQHQVRGADHLHTADIHTFSGSIQAEQSKTRALSTDLARTLDELSQEESNLGERLLRLRERRRDVLRSISEIEGLLSPAQASLNEMIETRSRLEHVLGLHEQIQRLETLRVQVEDDAKAEAAVVAERLQQSVLLEFSRRIAERLEAWGVPGAGDVRYDRESHDIATGDQLRSAHGKGVRAVLHAAFTVALAEYCFAHDLPHPGFVVLDSPLVTYRPPEQGGPEDESDRLNESVAVRFYEDLERNFKGQVIIMENMYPPNGLKQSQSQDIHFTKGKLGRYGFYPPR